MKRKIAFILTVIIICTLVIPLQSFAAGMDQALENAIKIAKAKFPIPNDYKFESSMSTDGGKTQFYLSWRNTDTTDGSSVNVSIDEKGTILGYNRYSPSDYTQSKKLPKLSRQDSIKKAEEYINNIDPALLSQITYQDNSQSNLLDNFYYLSYNRVVNGIPFYNNSVNISINKETGTLQSYNLQWTDDLVFPALGKQISAAQAEQFYKQNIGLRLIYKYSNTDGKVKVYAVYTPKYDNNSYAVDAFTGERLNVDYGYYGPYYGGMNQMSKKEMSRASMDTTAIQLNPDELKAVSDAAKLKTVEEAEKAARDAKFLGLTDDYKLNGYNLNPIWPLNNEYVWYLNFNSVPKSDTEVSQYVSVGVNAGTGKIVNFNRSTPYQQGAKAKYDLEASKTAVEAFLTEYFPDELKQTEYDETYTNNNIYYNGAEKPTYFNFKYDRLVNGTAFPDNGLNVDYDAVNGMVTSFNINWFNVDFPAVDKVLSSDSAYEKLFESIGLELQYKMKTPIQDNSKPIIGVPQVKPDIKLVYSLKPDKPLFLDGNTGEILDYDGNPYKEIKPVTYTDISDSYAKEQIEVLADSGIYLEGSEFKPDSDITQMDFFTLLSKTLSYYGPVITPKSTQKDVDNLYAFLIREGIVKQEEKAPEAAVTREDAVKFIIRAMKYDKVADIKGIYNCSFKDKDEINPNLTGYVTIAAGLKIVNGFAGVFEPKAKLTRAAAAVMIYNYLQV